MSEKHEQNRITKIWGIYQKLKLKIQKEFESTFFRTWIRCHLTTLKKTNWCGQTVPRVNSVRNVYGLLRNVQGEEDKPPVPSNVGFFAWRIMHDRLPTKVNLRKINISIHNLDFSCPLCHEQEESVKQLLFSCSVAYALWSRCWNWLGVETAMHCNPHDSFQQHHMTFMVWGIWLLRNNVIFDNHEVNAENIWETILVRAWQWISCKTKLKHLSYYEWFTNSLDCLSRYVGWHEFYFDGFIQL